MSKNKIAKRILLIAAIAAFFSLVSLIVIIFTYNAIFGLIACFLVSVLVCAIAGQSHE
jgi:c-di-AMP phosphodiesterase-like protein